MKTSKVTDYAALSPHNEFVQNENAPLNRLEIRLILHMLVCMHKSMCQIQHLSNHGKFLVSLNNIQLSNIYMQIPNNLI